MSDGAADERAKSAAAYLATVDTVGLDPNDYPIPDFKSAATPEALAEDELKFTTSVLNYARQAQIGRIHFSRVGADIEFKLVAPEPAEVLAKLANDKDTGKALDSYNPPQPEFAALKAKLAELRNGGGAQVKAEDDKKTDLVQVPEGKILRPGMKDARVIALRKRLDIAGDKDNPLYDNAVRDAVKTFQTASDIGVDGNLGSNTVRALNGEKKVARGPSANPIDTIIVNMERWRWLPRDLGNPHVIVNVPDYTLTLYNNGKVYWHTKIVAGKPGKATPMVSAEMKFITVNPTWNVPPSIIENEYLPALQEDPQALDRIGLKSDAGRRRHHPHLAAAGRRQRARPHPLQLPEQVPGLPARHAGQVSVRQGQSAPTATAACACKTLSTYGEKLLSLVLPNEHYTEAKLEKMFGGNEININFPKNDLGPSDLPDRLRRRRRQAADAQGCLRPRRQNDRHPQGQRAQSRRHRDRAAAGYLVQAGTHAGRHVWRQQWLQ